MLDGTLTGIRGIGLGVLKTLLEVFHANVVTVSRSVSKELAQLAEKHPGNLTVLQGDMCADLLWPTMSAL